MWAANLPSVRWHLQLVQQQSKVFTIGPTICHYVMLTCPMTGKIRMRTSASVAQTMKSSPAAGRLLRPVICTAMEGMASDTCPRLSLMSLTCNMHRDGDAEILHQGTPSIGRHRHYMRHKAFGKRYANHTKPPCSDGLQYSQM